MSTNKLNIKDPFDLAAFIVVSLSVLSIAFFVGQEGLKVDFTKKGKEFYGSSQQRMCFYFSLMLASLYKFICMSIEALLFSDTSCIDNHLCSFVRFSPDIAFITSFSILFTFWAQLGFDSTGVHSSFPRKCFQVGISLLAGCFLPIMLIHPQDEPNTNLFIFLGISHLLFFFIVIIVCFFVSKQILSTITIGKKILNRVIAITIICCYSSLLNSFLYLFVMQTLWSVGYPNHRLLLFDGVIVCMKDVIPIYCILYFTSKKKTPPPANSNRNLVPSILSISSNQSSQYQYTRIPEISSL